MQVLEKEIVAMEGKYIARKGTDNYFRRCTLLAGETEADFVEVDALPDEGLEAAKETKKKEIEAYDKSSAVNEFSINGHSMWYTHDRRSSMGRAMQATKASGIPNFEFFDDSGWHIELPIDDAIAAADKLELYAMNCLINTNKHLAAVDALTSIADVEAYDYRVGYPQKLSL